MQKLGLWDGIGLKILETASLTKKRMITSTSLKDHRKRLNVNQSRQLLSSAYLAFSNPNPKPKE